MGIGRVYPGMATPGYSGNQKIGQGELVSLGSKVASEVRRGAPIVPAGLDVMRQLQSGRNPIRLIFAPKTQKDFGDNGSQQSYSIGIKQLINGDFLW